MLYNVTEQLKGAKTRAEEADRRALEAARMFRGAEEARVAGEGDKRRVDEVCPCPVLSRHVFVWYLVFRC